VPATWPTASGNLRSLQTARWQLIEQTEAPDQLYDLQADPRESTNLAQDSRFAGMLSALQRRLAEEVTPARTGP
jgi:hypothetical protein